MAKPTFLFIRAALLPAAFCMSGPGPAASGPARFEEIRLPGSLPRFIARDPGATAEVAASEIRLSLAVAGEPSRRRAIAVRFAGSNPHPDARGVDPLPGRRNRYLGNDPTRWTIGISAFAGVEVHEVYPGIDLVVRGEAGSLEYDFVVLPFADPRLIQLDIQGACPVELTPGGDLLLHVPGSDPVRHGRPVAYQRAGDQEVAVAARYRLQGPNRVALILGPYDRGLPLVIDPVLGYSTYLGGGDTDTVAGMAVDAAGNAYLVGTTSSADFPLRDSWQPLPAGDQDVFVTKLDPTGALIYSTYIGGLFGDFGYAIAVDTAGSAYVTGHTGSDDFPIRDAFQPAHAGESDAFVLKLDAAGALAYSTYLGGGARGNPDFFAFDLGTAIAVDGAGNAYVGGWTGSGDFPTLNAFRSRQTWVTDSFVTKLSPSGSALIYSTYLGGSGEDYLHAIAVDGAGSAYVTGETDSGDFPRRGPMQWLGVGFDAFVTKLEPSGSDLAYSVYIGGNGADGGFSIAVDGSGSAYVCGGTGSDDYPLQDPLEPTLGTRGSAFLTKLDPSASGLVYSTYLGASGGSMARALALEASGQVHVAGRTDSVDLPTRDPVQPANAGGRFDAFLMTIDAAGSEILFSSYLGGTGSDIAHGVGVDAAGNRYVAGETDSTDFPILAAFAPTYRGGTTDGFATRICPAPAGTLDPVGNTLTVVKPVPSDQWLRWTDVPPATSYVVYRDEAKDGPYAARFGTAPSGTTGLQRPQPPESRVFFRVAAAGACVESSK